MEPLPYNAKLRRQYIQDHLTGKFGWRDPWDKGPTGWSTRMMASEIARHFRCKPVSQATILNDLAIIRKEILTPTAEALSEAAQLLEPERFPEWRARFFTDPATGNPYETPRHQLAWFHVFVSLAFKEPLPMWVHSYLELDVELPELNRMIADGDHLISLLLLAPPRHGKTELLLHSIIWAICRKPSIRIIYVAGILSTSKQNMGYVKAELESNEELNRLYGPFQDDKLPWSSDQLMVRGRETAAKAPTMLPAGKGTNLLSRDADIIVVDDPQDIDAAESEAQTQRDYVWLTTQVMTRREPHTALMGIGSHLPSMTGDLWERVKENASELSVGRHKLLIVEQKAHDYERCDPVDDPDHSGCILWPTLRPFWFLEAQRAAMGDVLFEACFNQNIRTSKVEYFGPDLVRGETGSGGILDTSLHFSELPRHCNVNPLVTIGFDPAAGETKTSSESALVVLAGCPKCEYTWVVDYWHARVSPETHADTILGFVKSYGVNRVRIEINAYQKALARDPRLVRAQSKYGFMIDPWMTDARKNDPMLGIPLLERSLRNNTLVVPYAGAADQQKAEDLLKALIRWPKRPNDIPMALWLAYGCWVEMHNEYTNMVPDVMPGWSDLSEHLQQSVYAVDVGSMTPIHEGIQRYGKLFSLNR